MFGLLKDKLKTVLDKFTKSVKEKPEQKEEVREPEKKELDEEKSEEKKIVKRPVKELETDKKAKQKDAEKEKKPIEREIEEKKSEKKEPVKKETSEKKAEITEETDKKKKFKEELEEKEPKGAEAAEKEGNAETEEKKEIEEKKEKKGILKSITERFTTTVISENDFNQLYSDLEMALLENSVAMEVVEHIKMDMEKRLINRQVPRGRIEKVVREELRKSIEELFSARRFSLPERIRETLKRKRPFVICFVGVNGCGKTTTIAKVVQLLKRNNLSCVIAASDTFRAAAIDQLEEHANRLGVKLIKHDYGADPAAVAFDAIKHAEAKNIDVVLIDTSGRMHSKKNLMDEMKKIVRVAKPDLNIFVGEAITGNDAVEQAKSFNETISMDAIILAKADVDEKGGAAISVSFVTSRPLIYLGTGQGYDDLVEFNPEIVVKALGLAS